MIDEAFIVRSRTIRIQAMRGADPFARNRIAFEYLSVGSIVLYETLTPLFMVVIAPALHTETTRRLRLRYALARRLPGS